VYRVEKHNRASPDTLNHSHFSLGLIPRQYENQMSETNGYRPNCLTPNFNKPKPSSPAHAFAILPLGAGLATSPYPPLGRSKRVKRPCRLSRSRLPKASRAWAGLRRPPRRRRSRARYRPRDDEDDAETDFAEYDFHDSSGVGWQGFGGDGGPGGGCGDRDVRR
jgi:hypothetical protein